MCAQEKDVSDLQLMAAAELLEMKQVWLVGKYAIGFLLTLRQRHGVRRSIPPLPSTF